jgi:rod shape determining protein RodA
MLDAIKNFFKRADIFLLLLCLVTSAFGLVLVYSATRFQSVYHSLPYKQAAAMAIGVVVFVVCNYIDLEILMEKWKLVLVMSSLFLMVLIPFGTGYQGNRNWLEFSWLPFSIMPAEIVKLFFVMLMAKQLVYLQRKDKNDLSRVRSVAQLVLHLGWFCGLIFVISGDAGSALVYAAIFVIMCWIAGLKKRWFLLGALATAAGGAVLWSKLPSNNYWKMRILVVLDHTLDPTNKGWNQARSLLAIRSGGLTGEGYLQGLLTQNPSKNYLPERYTDFIFSTCAEEWGLLGCMVLLVLLAAIILRCLYVGLTARSAFSALVAMGYSSMLIFQVGLNVGMCLYVMPVVGITLPFISYGGSSIITLYAAMGFISGIKMRSLPSWLSDRTDIAWKKSGGDSVFRN